MSSAPIGCGDGPEQDISVWTLAERVRDGLPVSSAAHRDIARVLLEMRPADEMDRASRESTDTLVRTARAVLAGAKVNELRSLCKDLLESARLANNTSAGYRDLHMAYQRWAAVLAPAAIGDDAKRAAIDTRLRTAEHELRHARERLESLEAADIEASEREQ